MNELLKRLSLSPRGIKHKLTVIFALISLIPMLVCGFFIAFYITPSVSTFWPIYFILIITLFIILLGCYLARKMIYPLVEISAHAKEIAEGRTGEVLEIKGEDEIGELSGSLNRLSGRIKENMTELRSYGEKIKQINMEINRKVFALSSLLQIGNLITANTGLDEVFNLVVEKLAQLQASGCAFIMLVDKASGNLAIKAEANIKEEAVRDLRFKVGQGLLGKVLGSLHPLVIDMQRKLKAADEDLHNILQIKNVAVIPITSSGRVIGVLGTGNNLENFLFSDDEIELIGVFAKQVAVAMENDILLRKAEELSVTDELTGLYNESYIRQRLDEEIKRAINYQRPCALIIFDIDNFEQYRDFSGEILTEKTLKKIAHCLTDSTTDIDRVARFSDHQFALVLPEKNKRQAFTLAENIKREIERIVLHQEGLTSKITLTISGSVSATPIDGTTSLELTNKALYYIDQVKSKGGNNILAS